MRSRVAIACLLAGLIPLSFTHHVTAEDELTIVSWGGAYTRSQIRGFVRAFEAKHDVDVEMIDYTGGIDEIRSQVRSWNVKWDVVDLEMFDAFRACEEGLLVRIDPSTLPPAPDGTPAAEDFIPGSLTPCTVGNVVFATVIAWDNERLSEAPASLDDFFDIRNFPGPRGLRRTPQTNLEWALIADGVAPADVYDVLETEEGVDRAFNMLSRIKPRIEWWEYGDEAVRLLETGRVVMTSAYNGRISTAVADGAEYKILWDHHVRFKDAWGIPKHGENVEAALEFVLFATSTESLAAQAQYIDYGPLRRSSLTLLSPSKHKQLPTSPENLDRGFDTDPAWWSEHMPRLQARFERWLVRPYQVPKDWPSR